MEITEKVVSTHEQVLIGREAASGYHGIIAIHSTALGPAVGGTRFWHYETEADALTDALRLSHGMTYKNALAGLPLGGGKSIIIGDNNRPDRDVTSPPKTSERVRQTWRSCGLKLNTSPACSAAPEIPRPSPRAESFERSRRQPGSCATPIIFRE